MIISEFKYNNEIKDSWNNSAITKINIKGISGMPDGEYNFAKRNISVGEQSITCNNAVHEPIYNMGIYGNSVQDGTPTPETPIEVESVGEKTKNLFDYISGFQSFSNGITNTLNGDGTITTVGIPSQNYIHIVKPKNITDVLEDGETYTLSQTLYNVAIYAQIRETDVNTQTSRYIISHRTPSTFKVDKSTYTYEINVQTTDSSSWGSESLTITNGYQLEKGDVATGFEPYGYKIPVKATGKNLCSNEDIYFDVYNNYLIKDGTVTTTNSTLMGFIAKVEPNTEYTVSYNVLATDGVHNQRVREYSQLPTDWLKDFIIQSINTPIKTTGITTQSFTTSETTKYIIFGFYANIGGISIKDFQVEKGSNGTQYEPYIEPTTTNIYLKEPLRKIGDYADYIDYKNKKIIRKIKNLKLISSQDWKKATYGTNSYSYYVDGMYKLIGTQALIYCTHFKGIPYGDRANEESNVIYVDYTDYGVYIRNTNYTTLEDLKTFFNNNDVYIDYILITPIEETIELPSIATSKGTNIFDIETSIKPSNVEIEYWKQIFESDVQDNITQDNSNILIVSTGANITQNGNVLAIGG